MAPMTLERRHRPSGGYVVDQRYAVLQEAYERNARFYRAVVHSAYGPERSTSGVVSAGLNLARGDRVQSPTT